VRLSVTRRYCVEKAKHHQTVLVLSSSSSHIIRVSVTAILRRPDGDPLTGASNARYETSPFSTNISLYFGNNTLYRHRLHSPDVAVKFAWNSLGVAADITLHWWHIHTSCCCNSCWDRRSHRSTLQVSLRMFTFNSPWSVGRRPITRLFRGRA